MSGKDQTDSTGMQYLESLPRRWVVTYIPVGLFLFILLFPFYWMTITAFKPNEELLSRDGNPFWVSNPTLAHFKKLLFDTAYPEWLFNTMLVSVIATVSSMRMPICSSIRYSWMSQANTNPGCSTSSAPAKLPITSCVASPIEWL